MASPDRDRFGGCTKIQFEATGFFRLEKTDRWWLVTPEGNAFLSFGVNHVMLNLVFMDCNIDHWAKEFGIDNPADKKAFLPGFRKKVNQDLAALGMNTLGCHSPTHYYDPVPVPYVAQCRFVDICHYMEPAEDEFHDVFSEDFVAHCDAKAKETVAPKKDDPFVIGYSMSDCPIFTDLDALPRENNVYGKKRIGLPTWPRVLRNKGPQAAGKQTYVETIREAHADSIQSFNDVYGTQFGSFDDLLNAVNWRPSVDPANKREEQDNLKFLFKTVDRCYAVESAAIRKYDPNHLVFGDKLNGNTDTPDEIVTLADKYMDLVFYQYYAHWDGQKPLLDRWGSLTGKAFFQGDSSFSVPNENMPDPYGPHSADQDERARLFIEAFENCFARKNYVGWDWCGWMDSWETNQPGKQHSGVQDPSGNFHEPIAKAMADFSKNMYEIAAGG